jgi:hypothetical protein
MVIGREGIASIIQIFVEHFTHYIGDQFVGHSDCDAVDSIPLRDHGWPFSSVHGNNRQEVAIPRATVHFALQD